MTGNNPITASFPSSPVAVAQIANQLAEMIEKLPAVCYPADGVVNPLLQQAGVESFFVSVRCLTEFLGVHGGSANSRDSVATDLLPNWSSSTNLRHHWEAASKHVMHFSKARTTPPGGPDVDRAALEAIANDVLIVWEEFVDQVTAADLMIKVHVHKRGHFPLWNVDGTITSRATASASPESGSSWSRLWRTLSPPWW